MEYLFYFLTVVIFTIFWSIIMVRLVPIKLYGIPAKKVKKELYYDERQTTIITEIIARTFMMTFFGIVLNLILRIFNLDYYEIQLFDDYPELMYIIIAVIFIIFNYFLVNKKYTSKGKK
ncbi:hypothetical protein [Staphylococcus epidermidis]|uniref:hypothetical protein n=1 Tax=Staphylococcus epidermidis TaxID=1282 RepID=UPI00138E0FD5